MAARRGAAHSPSAEVPLAVRWALNGEGDAGGIIGMYELRQVLHRHFFCAVFNSLKSMLFRIFVWWGRFFSGQLDDF